jgi:hypothetical protein
MEKHVRKYSFILILFTGILIGICIGAVLLNALISYRIDEYFIEIQQLNTIIENKDDRLEKLETSLHDSKLVLTDIKINLSLNQDNLQASSDLNLIKEKDEFDAMDKITLETAIREKYKQLIGREVKEIDSSLLGEIVNNRIMRTEHAEYKLYVTRIVLSDILELWIEVDIT